MQKKLMAVAVAGALAAPAAALAQTSTVNMYGTITMNYILRIDPGALKQKQDMFNSHDSRIGFRGEEKLGGGLSSWFQCESTLDATGEETGGPDAANGFCTRNSGFGFRGAFGNIFWGNWDQPAKLVSSGARVFGSTGVYGHAQMMWNGSAGNTGNGTRAGSGSTNAATAAGEQGLSSDGANDNANSFFRRQMNSWHYHSPVWSGFQVMGSFSAPDEATAATPLTTTPKARMWSLGGQYTSGPLFLSLGYEQHKDFNPAQQGYFSDGGPYTGGTDRMWQLGAAYTFANVFRLTGLYTDVSYDTAGGLDMKRKSWLINMDWTIAGPHTLRAGYTNAGDAKGTAALAANGAVVVGGMRSSGGLGSSGAQALQIPYAYKFSKRTEVNFGYSVIDNDTFARYAIQTASNPATGGQKTDAWNLGINHRF